MGTYIALKVKWQKQKYDVSVRLDAPAEELKSKLFELTGVSPERQKITSGGKQITDATDLSSIGLKEKQVVMLFGSPEEVLKVPTEAMFNSPSNVVDMFERMQIQGRESSTQIGEALTAAGHDYMQIANCLIICRPKTTVEAKQWISDNLDGAASTHIAGQKVPSNWQTGVEYVLGVPEQQFTLGEIVVLNRSDGSVKFGLLQQLRVMPNTHLVLVECEADFQGRGAQAGKAVAIEDIGKLKIDDDQIPPV